MDAREPLQGSHYAASTGRPPPEQAMDPNSMYASNGRPEGAPPPKKRLMRLGEAERSQSPADLSFSHSGAPNFSRSSSSDTIASQMNQFSMLSQQNSATGSPAPSGSPALGSGSVGQDYLNSGSSQIPTPPVQNSAQASLPSMQFQNSASPPNQPSSDEVYTRFKASWPHLPEEQVRDALHKANNDPGAATQILCNSNPLLDGYSGPSPSPAAAVSQPQQAPSASVSPFQGLPHQQQQQFHPAASMHNGVQGGYPRVPGHHPQQPHQMPHAMQMPNMQRPYPQQSGNPMFMSQNAPRPGMNQPQQFYPANQMYRGPPTQALPQQHQQPHQQARPGFNPVVSTRTVMPPTGPVPQMPITQQQLIHFMTQHRMDINNPQLRMQAAQHMQAQLQQRRFQGMSSLDAQRQMLQNPAEVERMRQQQTQAHQAQMAAHAQRAAQQARQGVGKNAVSKLVAAHRPQAAPTSSSAAVRKQKRKHADSDSEDGGNWSDGSDGGARYEEYVNVEKEGEALAFFNTCTPEQLPDYTACTPEAAQAIVSLRPFESPDDIRAKLKKTKGISNKLFDSVVDVFEVCLVTL